MFVGEVILRLHSMGVLLCRRRMTSAVTIRIAWSIQGSAHDPVKGHSAPSQQEFKACWPAPGWFMQLSDILSVVFQQLLQCLKKRCIAKHRIAHVLSKTMKLLNATLQSGRCMDIYHVNIVHTAAWYSCNSAASVHCHNHSASPSYDESTSLMFPYKSRANPG